MFDSLTNSFGFPVIFPDTFSRMAFTRIPSPRITKFPNDKYPEWVFYQTANNPKEIPENVFPE